MEKRGTVKCKKSKRKERVPANNNIVVQAIKVWPTFGG
jgi:hypothetical protein